MDHEDDNSIESSEESCVSSDSSYASSSDDDLDGHLDASTPVQVLQKYLPVWKQDPDDSFSDWKIIVKTEDEPLPIRTYYVHKIYLARGERGCRYFDKLFRLPLKTIEHEKSESVLKLPALCVKYFDSFLRYVYKDYEGFPKLTSSNVLPMFELARRLDNRALRDATKEWIKAHLQGNFCRCALTLLYHSLQLHVETVRHISTKVVIANFSDFFKKNLISVHGAGVDAINGDYMRCSSDEGRRRYIKKVKSGDEEDAFYLCCQKTTLASTLKWSISSPSESRIGNSYPEFYVSHSHSEDTDSPPKSQSQWTKNGLNGADPSPQIFLNCPKAKYLKLLSKLPFDILIQILESDDLEVQSEDHVYDTVASLIQVMDLEASQKEQLWKCVRFGQLKDESIAQLAEYNDIPSEIIAKDLIMKVGKEIEPAKSALASSSDDEKRRFQPRAGVKKLCIRKLFLSKGMQYECPGDVSMRAEL